jgi:hypothetical protein
MSDRDEAVLRELAAEPPVTFTIDETAVMLGLLRLVHPEIAPDVQLLSSRVMDRVEDRLGLILDRHFDRAPSRASPQEIEALRLARLLSYSLEELGTIVGLIEELTEADQRPPLLMNGTELACRSLNARIGKLVQEATTSEAK